MAKLANNDWKPWLFLYLLISLTAIILQLGCCSSGSGGGSGGSSTSPTTEASSAATEAADSEIEEPTVTTTAEEYSDINLTSHTLVLFGISNITVDQNAPETAVGPAGLSVNPTSFSLDLTNYVSGDTSEIKWNVLYVDPTKLTVSVSGNFVTFYLVQDAVGTNELTFVVENPYGNLLTDLVPVIINPV